MTAWPIVLMASVVIGWYAFTAWSARRARRAAEERRRFAEESWEKDCGAF